VSDEPAPGAVESTPSTAPVVSTSVVAPVEADPRARWLREHRLKLALGITIAETIFVVLEEDFSRLTVLVIAIPVVLFYLLAGRTLESPLYREISWILAVSQIFAAAAAVVALTVSVAKLVLALAIGAAIVYVVFRQRTPRPDGSAK
jgi:hypothetical protein